MFVGIDVGGTYTDAVLIDKEKVVNKCKFPTMHDDLLHSLLQALDQVIANVETRMIERVVISTTLITNLIAEDKCDPVVLLLIPGPGMNPADYPFQQKAYVLSGGIDYRGREIIPLDEHQLEGCIESIKKGGFKKVAVAGKFSCRNNAHENHIGRLLGKAGLKYELGHRVSSQLNYIRRAATTVFTVATVEEHSAFVDTIKAALLQRDINAPVLILKADGGTLPIENSKSTPVETIFSGPAASTLGAMALSPQHETSVVADIGGTTTDLALILNGQPLLAAKGVTLNNYYTSITSFAVRSVPIGGDSAVELRDKEIVLLTERKGPAYCFGGPVPTPTDAMLFLGLIKHGDAAKAEEGIKKIADMLGTSVADVAAKIMQKVTQGIANAIENMFHSWEQEPAYRVWELLQKEKVRPQNIIGVGGAAQGMIPAVAQAMGCKPIIPEHAEVANAIGAAVAQPTLKVSLRIDTGEGVFTVVETGFQGRLHFGAGYREQDALTLAKEELLKTAAAFGLQIKAEDIETVHSEVFNVIRGYSTVGRIYDITVQSPRSILTRLYKGGDN